MRRIAVFVGVMCASMWAAGAWASVTVVFDQNQWVRGDSAALQLYNQTKNTWYSVNTSQGGMLKWSSYSVEGLDAEHDGKPANSISTPLFCIEIPEEIYFNKSYIYGDATHAGIVALADAPKDNNHIGYATPMGDNAAGLISELWGEYYGKLTDTTDSISNGLAISAFQAAIWKLEYDGGSSVWTAGNLRGQDNAVTRLATTWINTIQNGDVHRTAELVALSASDQQDFMGMGKVYSISTPEPASLVIWSVLGVGMGGLALRRRRSNAGWSPENRQAIQGMIESKFQR